MLHIGCHLSPSKGYRAMGKDALSIGADTYQFFTRNPRGSKAAAIREEDAEALAILQRENGFFPVVSHAPYTLNPCSADEKVREFARMTMKDDLKRLSMLPCSLYNFHPGSHTGQGIDTGIRLTADLLKEILASDDTDTMLLIETMSGQGSEIGGTFEEVREIIRLVDNHHRVGVCLDTCHIFAAGYDIRNDLDRVLEQFDRTIGLDRLKAIHLNDSMKPFSSHRDRHACIGAGEIGFEALLRVTRHDALQELPFILETPQDSLMGWKTEIELLRNA